LRSLIVEHERETGSRVAEGVLRDWDLVLGRFWQICPKEMVDRLAHPLETPNPAEAAG
jgi:glutamate synthase (NADPH/NADH) large chain